jgi:hypothetical protein
MVLSWLASSTKDNFIYNIKRDLIISFLKRLLGVICGEDDNDFPVLKHDERIKFPSVKIENFTGIYMDNEPVTSQESLFLPKPDENYFSQQECKDTEDEIFPQRSPLVYVVNLLSQ